MLGLAAHSAPLQRQTLVDSVYQEVLAAILGGRLVAGTEFSEVAMARELGVSRTPVHEALARLAADDLVEILPSGVRIRKLSAQEVTELYEVRQLLECEAASRAATRLAPAVLKQLKTQARVLSSGQDEPDWPARAIEFDIHFHDELAAASGNARLRTEIGRYRLLVRAFCRLTGENLQNLRDSLHEHITILKALEKQDTIAAPEAMAAHITRRLKAVLAAFYPGSAH